MATLELKKRSRRRSNVLDVEGHLLVATYGKKAAIATMAMLALTGCAMPSQRALATVTNTVTATLEPPAPPGQPKTIFAEGLYQVGVDIAPGIYRSAGANGSNPAGCYWARLKSLNTSDYIDSNISNGPQVVQIDPTDKAFKTTACQPWQKTD